MKNKGFTLIELLMVSAIISLLMSVVFFNVTEAKKKGEDAHMRAESAEVAKAVYQYKDDNNGYVPGGLTVTGPGSTTLLEGTPEYDAALQELVDSGYLSEIPYSPSGSDYSYIISADGLDGVFAADLNYEYVVSGDNRNSCEWTDTGGDGGGPGEPPCTEPELPPDMDSLYGYSWYYSAFVRDGFGSYPEYLIGSCGQTYPSGVTDDLYDYWNENGYTCIDHSLGNFNSMCTCSSGNYVPSNPDATPHELCQGWGNSGCGGFKASTDLKAFVYDAEEFSNVREYTQMYEEPYNEALQEYDTCMVDNADQYDGDGNFIGGGDGGDGGGDICDGSSETDFCTCM